jgi:hypothetical protein
MLLQEHAHKLWQLVNHRHLYTQALLVLCQGKIHQHTGHQH